MKDKYIDYLLTNNAKGITEIYDTYLPKIEAIIGGMGGSKDESWEIFQESLIVILQKAQSADFN